MATPLVHIAREFAASIVCRCGALFTEPGEPPEPVFPQVELTPAQRDRMALWTDQWAAVALRTTPLTAEEWSEWEDAARKCYAAQGIPWPGVVIRVPSPLVGALAPAVAAGTHVDDVTMSPALREAVDAILVAAGPGAIEPAFGSMPVPDFFDVFPPHARKAMRRVARGVLAPVMNAGSTMDGTVFAAAKAAIPSWRCPLGDRALTGLIAFAAFFRDVVELPLEDDLRERSRVIETAWSAGYWWAYRDFVVVCEPPTALHTEGADGAGSLHNASGPALGWRDGWVCTSGTAPASRQV